MGNRWTPAEDRKLAKMRDEGKTFTQIAKAMGRSAPACQQRHMKNQNVVSETLTTQDVGKRLNEISLASTQPKPKPAWWSAMMWWRK